MDCRIIVDQEFLNIFLVYFVNHAKADFTQKIEEEEAEEGKGE